MSANTVPAQKEKFRRLILKQERSGFGVSEFCKKNLIPLSSFYYWRLRIFGRRKATPTAPVADISRNTFVPVPIVSAQAVAQQNITITLPDATRISIPAGCGKEALSIVFQSLVRSEPCSCN